MCVCAWFKTLFEDNVSALFLDIANRNNRIFLGHPTIPSLIYGQTVDKTHFVCEPFLHARLAKEGFLGNRAAASTFHIFVMNKQKNTQTLKLQSRPCYYDIIIILLSYHNGPLGHCCFTSKLKALFEEGSQEMLGLSSNNTALVEFRMTFRGALKSDTFCYCCSHDGISSFPAKIVNSFVRDMRNLLPNHLVGKNHFVAVANSFWTWPQSKVGGGGELVVYFILFAKSLVLNYGKRWRADRGHKRDFIALRLRMWPTKTPVRLIIVHLARHRIFCTAGRNKLWPRLNG